MPTSTRARIAPFVLAASALGLALWGACRRSVSEDRAPEVFADEICGDVFACDCDPPPYATEEECRAEAEANFLGLQAAGVAAGLTYDPVCAGAVIDVYGSFNCQSTVTDTEGLRLFCDILTCPIYHGEADAGDPCLDYDGGLSDCARGLACVDGFCVDFGCELREGDVCWNGNDFAGLCRPDLACDVLVTFV